MKRLLLAIGIGFAGDAVLADTYAGIRASSSRQEVNQLGRVGSHYSFDDTASVGSIFAGIRGGVWALEFGIGQLGARTSHNVSATFDIHQTIETRHVYAAALRHFPAGPLELHTLAGLSRVWMHNHEFGSNENGPNQVHRNSATDTAALFGLGFGYRRGRLALRLDLMRINNIARSQWTNSSDVTSGSISLQWRIQ